MRDGVSKGQVGVSRHVKVHTRDIRKARDREIHLDYDLFNHNFSTVIYFYSVKHFRPVSVSMPLYELVCIAAHVPPPNVSDIRTPPTEKARHTV